MLTVTQASPGIDEDFLVENPSKQLLLPSSISATSDGNTASKINQFITPSRERDDAFSE